MAKFKVGDKVAFKGNKSYKGVVQKVQPLFGHETIYTIKWNDGEQYDVTEGDLVIANSVRSCNSVVAKALNSKVAINSVDAKDKEEMAKFFKEMKDVISEISRLDMEFASYKKGLLNKAAKTQDKELADWVQKADNEWKNLKVAGKIKS